MSDDAPEDSPLAHRNAHFIDSEGARSLRIQAKYLSPLEAFRRELIHDTIVFWFCRKVRFFEQNRKTGHHKFNDLQDSKFIKNKLCDRTQYRTSSFGIGKHLTG